MVFLRLIKYPGAKNVLIPEISRVFRSSGLKVMVDVFGGSGSVSLNVNAGQNIYNDYESDLSEMFMAIQRRPDEVRKLINQILGYLEKYHKSSRKRQPMEHSAKAGRDQLIISAIEKFEFSKGEMARKGPNSSMNGYKLQNMEERAAFMIYRFSSSFGGMGKTYATEREKSVYRYISRTLDNYDEIAKRVKRWTIENMDFRDLIKKYDCAEAFFYLDPPYIGKQWYNYNFTKKDFEDIKSILAGLKGKYLMNLNMDVEYFRRIFGEPAFIRQYPDNNSRPDEEGKRYREKGFYTNVTKPPHRKQE